MSDLPLIKLCSSDPHLRGIQYGSQAKELILRAIEGYRRHFPVKVGRNWDEIKEKSKLYFPMLERDYPDELNEAAGIAEGADVSLEDIMALNCRYEILKLKLDEFNECTTASVLREATGSQDVFLFQNWDYRPWVENHAVVISIDNCDGSRILGLTEAGQLVRNGMNNRGIGVCANNLTSIFDNGGIGTPVTFLRRKVLNCSSFEDVCSMIQNAQRSVSCNFMVASNENKAADLETTPGGTFILEPQNGIVTHANHMVAGKEYCTNKGHKFRDKVMRRILNERAGNIDREYLIACARNHEEFPGAEPITCREAICTHVPCENYDPDQSWKTIASAIYCLNEGAAYICKGNPCCGNYRRYEV